VTAHKSRFLAAVLGFSCSWLTGCHPPDRLRGRQQLAHSYCAACHAFPEPRLLDRKTWLEDVLPQMGTRLGVIATSLSAEMSQDPKMAVLKSSVSEKDWESIVGYYREHAPDSLPPQALPAQPQVDPVFFKIGPLDPQLKSSAIITLLKVDTTHERIIVGEAGTNKLRIFDWKRRMIATNTLPSPATDVIVDGDHVLVLESGILDPNDQPKGSLVQFDFAGGDSLRFSKVLIDSLIRPVSAQAFDFEKNGVKEFLICEFGNNSGRLALYRYDGSRYQRQVLDPSPGAIHFEIRDMTGDGAPDITALFTQGDERIILFENDGKGHFGARKRVLARFPPVYGSMYFSLHDFTGDGKLDILYVNGDNYDYSRILKPYHGIRILENDGQNNFHERYFFPIYGAARAEVADFNKDGRLDILTTSNFADFQKHPERGIMYFENTGGYQFRPYSFSIASSNQWNLTAMGDFNKDGWPDVLIGAMDLGNVARMQRSFSGEKLETAKDPILYFENRMHAKPKGTP